MGGGVRYVYPEQVPSATPRPSAAAHRHAARASGSAGAPDGPAPSGNDATRPGLAGTGPAGTTPSSPSSSTRTPTALKILLPVGLLALIAVLAVLSLMVGGRLNTLAEGWARLPDALDYAFRPDRLSPEATGDDLVVVMGLLRVPRTLLALLVGAALGAAGTVIQGHTRNPLTDPGILGINAGAAAAVVLSIAWGLTTSPLGYLWPALMGCALVTAAVFALSSMGSTAANPLSIVLAGAALSAILMALVNAMVLSDDDALEALRQWATGSVAGRDLEVAYAIAPLIFVGLLLALSQGPALNLLALGETVARSLGLPVTRYRVIGLLAVALLGGAATAGAGPVAFVGLAAPHMVRAVVGPDYRLVVPYSALFGATLALAVDVLGRVIARPGELQMGVVMALVGVPFFILLIRRGKVSAL